ncbi:MAG: 50S ribosomal protein L1 [Planctomycetota bacterium]
MQTRSRRYRALAETAAKDPKDPHTIPEAVAAVRKGSSVKFRESVDLSLRLNIDTKKAEQLVRGSFTLPHGTGKSVRVVAFAEGPMAEAAKAAGAVEAGAEDLVEKILGGWMEFDVAVAHPSMMRHVGKLGKVLGPKGLMPSPKSGTVTPQVETAVKEFAGGRIEFRNDSQGNVSVCIGRIDFEPAALEENLQSFLDYIQSIRPATVKGNFLLSATLASTMGLGYRLAV